MATQSISRSCLQVASSSKASAAAAFVQLAPRRALHTSTAPVLDFLAPRVQLWHVSAQHASPKGGNRTSFQSNINTRRNFTSTNRNAATRAILNPAKDDDGSDMLLDITPRAAKRLREIMTKDSNPNLALRIQVESGGCHGFQYLLSLSSIPSVPSVPSSSSESSIAVEDSPALNTSSNDPNATSAPPPSALPTETTAQPEKIKELDEEDVVFEDEESKTRVVIDIPSLELLKGSKVEYTTGLIGSQFAVINPNSSSNCGCGTSFDIKI